ncbi:MAG TPA: DUF5689 domain-containing protein [Bacteroidales bacterium]|nr:DUF5689 domain-containing protein [Bacteroidales bacterium]
MKKNVLVFVLFVSLCGLMSCIHNDFDEPPLNVIPEGHVLTIEQIRNMYADSILSGTYLATYKFTGDYSVYAVVTMDDKSGNIYKTAYIQDSTGAINLHLLASGGLYEGDSVRVYLKGTVLGAYNNMLQIDSVDADKNVIKQATDRDLIPKVVTIPQILSGAYQGQLVQINDVQFIEGDTNQLYSDPVGLTTINRTIEDCNGNTIIVRTSGYASFAGAPVPNGKGNIIAIAGQYREDWQLYIRRTEEVDLSHLRCGEYNALHEEDFSTVENNVVIAISGWKNIATTGTVQWVGLNNGIDAMAKFVGTGNNTGWLISPAINLDATTGEYLNFISRAFNVAGASLKVYVSTNYTGGTNPEASTWTELSATIANSTTVLQSGDVDLSSYNGNIYIAFKYTATGGATGEFYIDNFVVATE